jgi:hypothetical protein
MKRADVKRKLADAMVSRQLVRLTRKLEVGAFDGYVIALDEKWFVVLLIGSAIFYDGFRAIRVQDVESLLIPSPYGDFYKKALRKRGLRRPSAPNLNISSTRELIESAGRRFPLVTIHQEKTDSEVCYIGRVISTSSSAFSLLEITPHAVWCDMPSIYRFSQITRIDFGGAYEQALYLVGDQA